MWKYYTNHSCLWEADEADETDETDEADKPGGISDGSVVCLYLYTYLYT
jgi:hypothetical protein